MYIDGFNIYHLTVGCSGCRVTAEHTQYLTPMSSLLAGTPLESNSLPNHAASPTPNAQSDMLVGSAV